MEDEDTSCYRVTDMIRATVMVNEHHQLQEAYEKLRKISNIKIVKIKNMIRLPKQCIVVYFMYH